MSIYASKKPIVIGVIPSNNIRHRNDPEKLAPNTSPTKVKEILNLVAGIWRVEFKLRASWQYTPVGAQIYRNGSAYGASRQTTSTTYITYQEDLYFNAGDLIQLYAWTEDSYNPAYVKELRLLGDYVYLPVHNTLV